VSTAKRFQKKMKDAGVKSELHTYPGQPHGFFNQSKGGKDIFLDTLSKTDAFLVSLGFLEGKASKAQLESALKK
jgi:acetyl esterase